MNSSKPVVRLGIDLGKNSFHLWGVDEDGRRVIKKKLSRSALLRELANTPACLIGMEACGGAHHWARELSKHGHDVRLMAPQFVKAYVKGNKNDYNDAEGICEAVGRENMRFVSVKSVEQMRRCLPEILETPDNGLSDYFRPLLLHRPGLGMIAFSISRPRGSRGAL